MIKLNDILNFSNVELMDIFGIIPKQNPLDWDRSSSAL